ncbi:exodeoxyribonuclease III [Paraburkholderia sp. Ac-20347]|jgi:exodeoxyribonuclease III|uniref:exodeoxyribonuclease III n=1 Tax=Paraburkholderia sp. Ac-20347 TaxID=2703892 RepID=UPI00197CFE23|nr:exodeoxyribonuclease III [Paraburkholderia sp. Ac-20347]MBN3810939.1 exodeoxyribonuclease III [Paraburkholderia sp. Ac-20347]
MKIATWNVNSLKVRLQHVIDWLGESKVDVLCLQELKLTDDKYPRAELEAHGYRSWFTGQKTYNGVAILVRDGLNVDESTVVRNIPGFEDPQQRVVAVTVEGTRIVCAYFPNGQAPGSEKFAYKLDWLNAMHDWLAAEMQQYPKLALLGDYNIAPEDRDVHDPKAWEGQNLVSPEERAQFQRLIALGFVDAFRQFEQPEKLFTWWDYRMFAFRRNAGLRIDHILLSPALATTLTACEVDKVPRKWEQPSDHTPVIAEVTLAG